MLSINPEDLVQLVSTVALAIIVVIVGYQKIMKEWRSNSAEASIINLMHVELERMSQQNTLLSNEIGHLNRQIIELNKQLQGLSVENNRLHSEVLALTNEVSEFKASMFMKGREHATSQN